MTVIILPIRILYHATINSMKKRIDWWNIFFSLFFVVFVYAAFEILVRSGTAPQSVSIWDAFLMMLATFRLTRLVVYDAITRWFRNLFADGEEFTFMGTIKTLVNCPWCVGLWFAVVVTAAYFITPLSWFFIFILALGGAATVVQLAANLLGWSAEYKKLKVLDKKD